MDRPRSAGSDPMLRRILPLLPAAALFGGSLLAQHPDPLRGQLPKSDLGVAALQARQPEYDGRGVRVAVLDTGIDPGHPFLQRASTGGRKIVDWYDATTDGRIDLVAVVGHEGGRITGLSGRALQLGRWAAPGREFRLGRIDSQFLPGGLAARLRSGRRSVWEDGRRRWQERQAAAVGAATDPAQAALWEHHEDPGPVWDLVVFEEQPGAWRLLIDNDEDGDLDEEPALRSFRESGDWAPLGDEALLHYAVSVAEDGASLRLFFDANGHGTHVAGIIGAWGGAGSRLNGLAPGVEFVAIKIGDGKYGGSTTGFSIGKALDYAVEAGCQVVNMSFGGPSFAADGLEPDAWAIDQAVARGL
ncbi:MAG TPA: S8 family serine peptidase, partial [Planctomycetota bacterium]